jgi:hypothetical protein
VLTLPCRFKDCTICLESLALHGPIAVTPCGHCLHKSCYDLWGAACTEQHRATTCPFCTQEVLEGQLFCFSFKNDPFLSGDAILPSTADLITTALTFPHASRDCGICLELLPRGGRPVVFEWPCGYCYHKHCFDALIRQSRLMSVPCTCRYHVGVEGPFSAISLKRIPPRTSRMMIRIRDYQQYYPALHLRQQMYPKAAPSAAP